MTFDRAQRASVKHRAATNPGVAVRSSAGFTLLELILATFISALVIGILSVCLSVALRIWEKNRGVEPGDQEIVRLLEVMTQQLGCFNPTPMALKDDNKKQLQFFANKHTLSFATNYSIKSISKGAPVISRYIYQPGSKRLYYAEIPMDPYHPAPLNKFLKEAPTDKETWPRYYAMEMQLQDLSFAYRGQKADSFGEAWDETTELPGSVLVKLSVRQGTKTVQYTRSISPHFLQFNSSENLWLENKLETKKEL
jgi:hypothetical protein